MGKKTINKTEKKDKSMKIIAEGMRNGRRVVMGAGTYEEVEALNIEKDFDACLDKIYSIKRTHNYLFNIKDPMKVDRAVYGKRKATPENS